MQSLPFHWFALVIYLGYNISKKKKKERNIARICPVYLGHCSAFLEQYANVMDHLDVFRINTIVCQTNTYLLHFPQQL